MSNENFVVRPETIVLSAGSWKQDLEKALVPGITEANKDILILTEFGILRSTMGGQYYFYCVDGAEKEPAFQEFYSTYKHPLNFPKNQIIELGTKEQVDEHKRKLQMDPETAQKTYEYVCSFAAVIRGELLPSAPKPRISARKIFGVSSATGLATGVAAATLFSWKAGLFAASAFTLSSLVPPLAVMLGVALVVFTAVALTMLLCATCKKSNPSTFYSPSAKDAVALTKMDSKKKPSSDPTVNPLLEPGWEDSLNKTLEKQGYPLRVQ